MFRFCDMFHFYLTIYYSTAEWSDDDHDFDYDFVNAEELYSHAEIIDQCDFKQVHLIDSCEYSNTTLGCDFFSSQTDTQIRKRTGGNSFFKMVSFANL